jgi:hypothetical protein
MTSGTESNVDRAASDLQRVTEELATALLGDVMPGQLVAAHAARDQAFGALRARVEAGERLGEAGQEALRMVRELDVELIALGETLQQTIRGERRDLARRRRTIAAHARRERVLPRALTVKA